MTLMTRRSYTGILIGGFLLVLWSINVLWSVNGEPTCPPEAKSVYLYTFADEPGNIYCVGPETVAAWNNGSGEPILFISTGKVTILP